MSRSVDCRQEKAVKPGSNVLEGTFATSFAPHFQFLVMLVTRVVIILLTWIHTGVTESEKMTERDDKILNLVHGWFFDGPKKQHGDGTISQ